MITLLVYFILIVLSNPDFHLNFVDYEIVLERLSIDARISRTYRPHNEQNLESK
jgi:hypothetical protein